MWLQSIKLDEDDETETDYPDSYFVSSEEMCKLSQEQEDFARARIKKMEELLTENDTEILEDWNVRTRVRTHGMNLVCVPACVFVFVYMCMLLVILQVLIQTS
jgi:hypothetical protein